MKRRSLYGFHGAVDLGMLCHDDDRQIVVQPLGALEQLKPVQVCQPEIGDQQIRGGQPNPVECGLGVISHQGVIPSLVIKERDDRRHRAHHRPRERESLRLS